jgi:phage host-nuclease inhibitor protein Gam
MTLKDIINPWGALAAARKDIADLESERSGYFTSQRDARAIAAVNEKAHALKVKNLRAEIRRLEEVIASGHYRNPETGRLGRKGEMFPPSGKTGGKA